jgi:hypothetical protein
MEDMTEVLRNMQEERQHAEESDDEDESQNICLEDGSSDESRRFTDIKYHRINQSPKYSLFCWRAERSDRKRIAFQRTD